MENLYTCSRIGCRNEAEFAPKIVYNCSCEKAPLPIILGITVCSICKDLISLDQVESVDLQEIAFGLLEPLGHSLDLNKTQLVWIEISGEEFQLFVKLHTQSQYINTDNSDEPRKLH